MPVAAEATATLVRLIILPITPPAELVAAMRAGFRPRRPAVTTCRLPKSALEEVSDPVRKTPIQPRRALKKGKAAPLAAKEQLSIRRSLHNRGYVAMADERLDPAAGADQKEAFNIGVEMASDHPEVLAGRPFRGVNFWPELPCSRRCVNARSRSTAIFAKTRSPLAPYNSVTREPMLGC